MAANNHINFELSTSDLDAIKQADKSLVKLGAEAAPSAPRADFSAWNCPYKECRPRPQ